jgi:hypothetical protein
VYQLVNLIRCFALFARSRDNYRQEEYELIRKEHPEMSSEEANDLAKRRAIQDLNPLHTGPGEKVYPGRVAIFVILLIMSPLILRLLVELLFAIRRL